MCGIFGYVGKQKRNVVKTILNGLKKLEYRGYDSSGIAGINDGELLYCKEVGKIALLEKQVAAMHLKLDIGIAHTRWATHGKPNRENAHPHFDSTCSLAVVHNGIIENYDSLRTTLKNKGVNFISTTDTEVIAHLIESYYTGDLLEAFRLALMQLKGAYAIALVHKDHPGHIFGVAHDSPLAIGIAAEETFLASDPAAFAEFTQDVIFLTNNEIGVVSAMGSEIYTIDSQLITKPVQKIDSTVVEMTKGKYEHYTLKEIFEQPNAISRALSGRLSEEFGTAIFKEKKFEHIDFLGIERIVILACGSSWHAGYIASYMIEELAGIPVDVEISSEYRYKNPVIAPHTLVIAISQSGETADTLAAMRELQAKGATVLGLCNVATSTLAREANTTIFLNAGPEIGVCSTKAFTNQLVLLSELTLMLARIHRMTKDQGRQFIHALQLLPAQIQEILDQAPLIAKIVEKYCRYENFFFLGRNFMFPTSLEGALKLKEIAYINASGYPAGEMKHGPIALINAECPTVALCANQATFTKLLSNLMEVKARNGLIIAIAGMNQDVSTVADDVIRIPDTIDALSPILVTIVTQLFAYYTAKERGTDIDQPRNLAKSVTVE